MNPVPPAPISTASISPAPSIPATCANHPLKRAIARGLCMACYQRERRAKITAEHKARNPGRYYPRNKNGSGVAAIMSFVPHYQLWDELDQRTFKPDPTPDTPDPCHLWCGSNTQDGYPMLRIHGVAMGAHRLVYALAKGSIFPEVVRQSCGDRTCVNPNHLVDTEAAVPQASRPAAEMVKPLDPEHYALARALFEYDAESDKVRWKPRPLSMFQHYKNPAYVMGGWTRAMAKRGWEVKVWVNPDLTINHPQWGRVEFIHKSKRYGWHMSQVYKLLSGSDMPRPTVKKVVRDRGPSRRDDTLGNDAVLRKFIAVDQVGMVRWQPVTQETWDWLMEARRNYGGYSGTDPYRSYIAYGSTKAGKLVTTDRDGLVRFGGQITVSWEKVCAAIGLRNAPEPVRGVAPKNQAPAISDQLLRMLMFVWRGKGSQTRYGWKPRSHETWQMMALAGVISEVPSATYQAKWNKRHGYKLFGERIVKENADTVMLGMLEPYLSGHDVVIKVGEVQVKGRRIKKALADEPSFAPPQWAGVMAGM